MKVDDKKHESGFTFLLFLYKQQAKSKFIYKKSIRDTLPSKLNIQKMFVQPMPGI